MNADLENHIIKSADKFKELCTKTKIIRCITHLDADGLCAGAIVANILRNLGSDFHLSIVKQLNNENIEDFSKEKYDFYIFSDLGSGQLEAIKNNLLSKGKYVAVLDHHEIKAKIEHENLIHVNPHIFGIDGSNNISGSGVCYLLSRHIIKDDLSHLAITGALGDMQEKDGFSGLNEEILKNAISKGKIKVEKGLNVFGRVSRPIHKALEYCTEPEIPGVTGDESGTIQFLSEVGIDIKNKNNDFRRLCDLNGDEMQRVINAIIIKRAGSNYEKPHKDIVSNIYISDDENENLADLREFATVLNACGRSEYPAVAMMLCMGDKEKGLKIAKGLSNSYRKKIMESIKLLKRNKEKVIKTEKTFYIVGKDDIDEKLIGTICSISLNSDNLCDKKIIVGFANTSANTIKISTRTKEQNINLKRIISDITAKLGGEGGGHSVAAGGEIPKGKEEEFINMFENQIKEIYNDC
ncbi:MAG: DHH family phosphoesterase [Candidatus Nanoarchaeia archaeon]|nr:DHH family phosphoesterase [Candidatus Nanoarchaeia archaeon]